MNKKKTVIADLLGHWWFKLLAAVLLAAIPVIIASKVFPAGQVAPHAPLPEFTAHLDRRIPAIMEDYEIPGLSVALIRAGRTVWREAYGYADRAAGREMTEETYCRLESISKSVTAWGVMKLAEEGRIQLDRPVQEYLRSWQFPDSPFSEEEVTVRRLLSGTAGMPLGTIGERYPPGSEEIPALRDYLSREALLFRGPGSGFHYSNTGFNILELLIEEVTGRDFAEYMEREILRPLAMEGASFQWRRDFHPPVANGYGIGGETVPVYVYPYRGAGNLFGTLDDVARFASAGMTEHSSRHRGVLTPQTIESMYEPAAEMSSYYRFVFAGYGLGHFVEFLPGPRRGSPDARGPGAGAEMRTISHGGQGTGWMTDFHAVPETGDGIVILSNSQRTWPGFAYILSDWARWIGRRSVGMGVIITVQKAAWAAAALTLALSLWQLLTLAEGLLSGTRHLAPPAASSRLLRSIQLAAAITFFGALLWTASLDYWFLDSVLPIASSWVDAAVLLAALTLAASALLPRASHSAAPDAAAPAATTLRTASREVRR